MCVCVHVLCVMCIHVYIVCVTVFINIYCIGPYDCEGCYKQYIMSMLRSNAAFALWKNVARAYICTCTCTYICISHILTSQFLSCLTIYHDHDTLYIIIIIIKTHTDIIIIYMYMYIMYMFVCLCVCVHSSMSRVTHILSVCIIIVVYLCVLLYLCVFTIQDLMGDCNFLIITLVTDTSLYTCM